MKKMFAVILCALLVIFAFTGCSNDTTSSTSQLDCLVEDGKLLCGTEIGYYPMEFYDDTNKAVGLDIDVANEVAKRLGLEVVIIDTAWDGIFAGLDANRYDIVFGATITPDRAENMEFSTPFIVSWQSVTVIDENIKIDTITDLSGLRVGFLGGSTSDTVLNDLIESGAVDCEAFNYEKIVYAFDDLAFGRLDAVICDSIVAEGYAEKDSKYILAWSQEEDGTIEPEQIGAAIKQDNTELLNAINEVLAEMEADGTLDAIRKEWLC